MIFNTWLLPKMNRDVIARIRRTDTVYRLRVAMSNRLEKPDQMELTAPVIVEVLDNKEVLLPCGFVTDCHSVPLWLGNILPEYDNRTNIAAVVHDYLYMHWEEFAQQPGRYYVFSQMNRKYADQVYLELMNRFHPGGWRNKLYYRAVRLFGGWNWDKYRRINQEANEKEHEKVDQNQ